MHLVGAHDAGFLSLHRIQYDAPLHRLRLENMDCITDCIIQIELLQLDLAFLQQSAQVPDDVARALIVTPNIGENVLQLTYVGRVHREESLGGLGVAQDGAQWLIEFVRDRSRKRASGGGTVQMDNLQEAVSGFELRDLAPTTLEQQPGNHRRLQQHDGENSQRLPSILVPQVRRTKTDFAFRRQPARADAEALQLLPVEHQPGEIAADDGNLRGGLAAENAQRDPCGCLSYRDGRRDEAPGAAIADTGFGIDYDRPVGDPGEGRETFMRNVGRPRAVERDARVYDRSIVRQRGHALSDLGHRQADQVDELELSGEGGNFVLVVPADGLALPRVTHQRYLLEIRHQRLRRRHHIAERQLIDRASRVGREVQSSRGLLVDRGKNHRCRRPQLRVRANDEFKRG